MFTLPHFIWLLAIALSITALIFLSKKFSPTHSFVQKAVMIGLVAMKIFHTALSVKESEFGGYVVKQTHLDFHLCSIQIYLAVLINVVKNEKFVKTIKSFMVPCMMIGATMALLIPTAGVSATNARVWEYMLAHAIMVFYGIYLMIIEKVDLTFKTYLTNLKLLLIPVVIAFLMNSILEPYDTNYMYLKKPPMDGLPLLNLNNGWYVYIVTLIIVACVLLFLVHLPFIIKEHKNKKINQNT